jgi:signal transduction histidine kinase
MKYSFGTRMSNSPPARSRSASRGETGHTRERTRAARDVHDHHS